MFARTWQLGIDIQPRTLCAVAITFHRKGWQLKRWWQFSSPINVVESGRLRQSDWLNHLLSELRSQLPRILRSESDSPRNYYATKHFDAGCRRPSQSAAKPT